VLISPAALKNRNRLNKSIPVNLTKKTGSKQLGIDPKKPVLRQQEVNLFGHYQWENYWGSGFDKNGFMASVRFNKNLGNSKIL
jgi:hypothetical protein